MSSLDTSQRLVRSITYISGLIALVPIILWPNSLYPHNLSKVTIIQTVALINLVLYFALILYKWSEYRPRFSWLGFSVALFYISLILSAYFGADWSRSWWSRAERGMGLFVMMHYAALFLVWRSVLTRDSWYRLWQWFVAIGASANLVAIFQFINPTFLMNGGKGRVISTIGNPIFAASFMLFLAFSAAIFALRSSSTKRWVWSAVAASSVLGIFLTQTRSTIIGLVVGLLVWALLFVISKTTPRVWKRGALGVAVALVVLIGGIIAFRGTTFVQSIPGIGRFVSRPLESATGGTRLLFWKVALAGWNEKKIFGWGWDNFYEVSNKYYLPEQLKYGPSEEWNDNAHNQYLNTLAVGGVVGLGTFMLMWAFVFLKLVNIYRLGGGSDKLFAGGLMAFFAGHLVQNIFIFESIISFLFLFFLFAGIDQFPIEKRWWKLTWFRSRLAWLNAPIVVPDRLAKIGPAVRGIVLVIVAVVSVGFFYRFNVIPVFADHYAARSVIQAATDFKGALETFKKSQSYTPNPYRDENDFYVAHYLTDWLHQHPDFAFSDYRALAGDIYWLGVDNLESYIAKHPRDVRAIHFLASTYMDGYDFWQNISFAVKAEELYTEGLKYSPKRQTLIFGLTKAYLQQEKFRPAMKLVEDAIKDVPELALPHWQQALVYLSIGNERDALQAAEHARELGYHFSQEELIVIFPIYKKNGVAEKLLDNMRAQIYESNLLNRRLIEIYVEYLSEKGQFDEAEGLKVRYLIK